MILELLFALFIGLLAGSFTGLIPGIHINLVAAFLISSLDKFSSSSFLPLAVFITSMSITHTFVDFIPSIFLGAPEEDTFLSILPGHQLLMKGQGYQAVVLTLYGSLTALIIILIATPIYILFLPSFYTSIKYLLPFILIFISAYTVLRDQKPLLAVLIFLLSGLLGSLSFFLPVKEPLIPLLAGLFGLSSIILSLKNKQKIMGQKILPLKRISLTKKEFIKSSFSALISAPLCSFLPGIGSGHAAFIGSEIIPQNSRGFLFLVGAINTIVMALSFVALYAIGRARSGSAAAIQELFSDLSFFHLSVLLTIIIFSGLCAFFITLFLAKHSVSIINKVNYSKISLAVIFILVIFTLIFSNPLGLIVLITSTSLGIYCIASNTKRINLMGALILPVVVYYLMN